MVLLRLAETISCSSWLIKNNRLIDGGHFAVAANEGALDGLAMDEAIECLASLHWDEYAGQVVEFLDADGREEYGTREAWRRLQMSAYSALENSA